MAKAPRKKLTAARALKVAAVWALLFFVLGEGGLRLLAWANRRWLLSPKLQSALLESFESPSIVENMRRLSPSLVYRNTPGYRTSLVQINSRGFRGEEFQVAKPTGTIRVVCLGDSCTFGWGVDNRHTYPALLEKNLRRGASRPVSVINAGGPGYSSWQALVWCREEIFSLEPDVLVVYVGWNDIFEAQPETGSQRSKRQKMAAYLLHQSVLITQMRQAFNNFFPEKQREAALYESFYPKFYVHQMGQILEEAKGRKIRVLLFALPTSYVHGKTVIAPTSYVAKNPEKFHILYERYNQAIRQLAGARGVELVDLTETMNGREEYFADFCHPSAAGNELIAQALAKQIRSRP